MLGTKKTHSKPIISSRLKLLLGFLSCWNCPRHTFAPQYLRQIFFAFFSSLLLTHANFSWADLEKPIPLNIPSQNFSDSLIELGAQAKISIIFPTGLSLDFDEKTDSVIGTYAPLDALKILIANKPIQWQIFNSQVISLSKKDIDKNQKFVSEPPSIPEVFIVGNQITGSRIKRLDIEGSAPVDIITEREISSRGVQTISDYLKFIPAVSGNSTSTAVSNGGDGTATITLRGLPASSTLVLINGRRTSNSGLAGDSVDLNSIPLIAVERIEVLKDGASAIYGSDAIAGVINIILKRSASGVLIDQYYGQTNRGDQETINTNLLAGFSTDNTDFMVSATHFDQKGIYSRDRSISENADGRSQGGVDLRSSATPISRINLPNDDIVILQDSASDSTNPNNFRLATSEDLYNYREVTSSFSPSTRSALNLSAVHLLSENTELIMQLGLTQTEATVTFAPTPISTAFDSDNIVISASNSFNPFGVDITDIRRRLIELGPRIQKSTEDAQRLNIQLESSDQNFHWDMAFNLNKTQAEKHISGIVDYEKLEESLTDNCFLDSNCVPLNLFGSVGSINSAQIRFIETNKLVEGSSQLAEFVLNGDTLIDTAFNSAIGIAGGLSVRRETAELDSDEELDSCICFSKPEGNRTVTEVYLEMSIPLVQEKLFVYQLDVDIASRFSKYSDFGETNNPKFGLRYRPFKNILLRNTYSKGFRAPSLYQLYQGESNSYDLLKDPCSMIENVGVIAGCTQQSDPTRFQFLTITGGNESLLPEKSTSETLGVVWTPEATGKLTISVDWFKIKLEDVIDARPQYIIDKNAELNLFPSQVIRDPLGNITTVYATNINAGNLNVEGADTSIHYSLPESQFGNFTFSVNSSYIHSYHQQSNPGSPSVDIAGQFVDLASDGLGAIPKWKINTGLGWSNNEWAINYNINYIDKLEEKISGSNKKRDIEQWITHSIQFNYSPNKTKGIRLAVGVDNAFDQEPPFAASAFNDNFDPRTYEIKGRSWYGRASYQF